MKTPLTALWALAALVPVLTFAESFPQLAPLLTKYTQDRKVLDDAREQQVETVRARYLAALGTARAEAVKANKTGAIAAIDAEMADAKADVHAPIMAADLPHTLGPARKDFLTTLETSEKTSVARVKDLNTRYLQTLTSLESVAVSQKNTALAEAIGQEKTRVVSAEPAATANALRRNVIINGDFSLAGTGSLPAGWQPKGTGYQKDSVPWANDALVVQEGSEKFLRFRRTAPVRLANVAPIAPIPIPPRAKAAVLSFRLRVQDLVPGKSYDRFPGGALWALDATGASPGPISASATENTRWRLFSTRLTLQPGAKTLQVSIGPWAASGICDFGAVEVKFE